MHKVLFILIALLFYCYLHELSIIISIFFLDLKDLDGRFIADQMIEHPNREDCYIARLLVRKVSPEDSKKYFLAVENIHGEDRYAVALNVKGRIPTIRRV